MCSIHSISRYNDFVLDLQDSSEVQSYQPVMNKVVSCKDSSGTIINDIHLLKLCYAIGCFDSQLYRLAVGHRGRAAAISTPTAGLRGTLRCLLLQQLATADTLVTPDTVYKMYGVTQQQSCV